MALKFKFRIVIFVANIIEIGNRRECFWDDFLVDCSKTTANFKVNNPTKIDTCFLFDDDLETESISYPCILKDDKGYKMYYIVHSAGEAKPLVYASVVESADGINWHKPELNIFKDYNLKINNVVMDEIDDNAFFFYDSNPDCPQNERYKAVSAGDIEVDGEKKRGLLSWVSVDGYNFTKKAVLTDKGHFDSLNTMFWKDGKYWCYFRGFHNIIPGGEISWATRDIRVMSSEDSVNWTDPKQIEYDDCFDHAMYTNNAIPYERAPHITIGFPTRYFERKGWSQNIKQMPSYDIKVIAAEKCELQVDKDRTGLVNTDAIFMLTRDGENWHRYNEVFMAPGYETKDNWIYGDGYPAYNLVDAGDENYYIYEIGLHLTYGAPKPLYRYKIRKDGFACIYADSTERTVVTKPFTFEGKDLHLNFSTSAFGYIFVDVLDEDGKMLSDKESFEIYGDTIDRKISFADGSDFSKYEGKPIRLRFRMCDAKLYSMKFE